MSETKGLKAIVVRQLFGTRNYRIRLDPSQPTVLTGANGTGKSTLLRLVNAASTGDMRAFFRAPLNGIVLEFEAAPPFIYERHDRGRRHRFAWGDRWNDVMIDPDWADFPEWARQAIEESPIPGFPDDEMLMDAARAAGVSYPEFREFRSSWRHRSAVALPETPEWFAQFGKAFPVLFVTDQRLVVEAERDKRTTDIRGTSAKNVDSFARPSRLAVEAASRHISQLMQQADSSYARVSQLEDRQFPRAVISAMSRQRPVPTGELEALIKAVEDRRKSLREVGLLDRETGYEPDLAAESLRNAQVAPVIATFLNSFQKKLKVLEDLSGRLRSFKSFLDQRFTGKDLLIDRREGVRFSLGNGITIRPSQLSSGEQQMMVLAFEVLFRAPERTLVIVDEPEISLHVLWQDTLIDNLAEMGKASNLQFLMATHSPTLLATHPELERSLDELSESA